MLEAILHFSIKNRWLIVVLALGAAILGAVSLRQLPIDAVPDIPNTQVQINTLFSSLSPTEMEKQGRQIPVLVQVNTGHEPQKAGILPETADAFLADARSLGLDIRGLMCIPPAEGNPAPHFALLSQIAERNGLQVLSMGMSGDFEAAVAKGATHVRVGTAIFGSRS